MPSIPVPGLAKALMAVTISLHPAAHHHGHGSYTVRPGDTLSAIAAHAYGNAADWPAVWWANRRHVANPNVITAGQRLRLPDSPRVSPAVAVTLTATTSRRVEAMNWAQSQKGCWYSWGHTGPCSYGYDCSGLVYRAYTVAGLSVPRTTHDMLHWWRLRRIYHPEWGALAFYGSGHVELSGASWGWTYGALESGTRVGWHHYYMSSWWHPTAFYRVYGAG